jgi:hypothetical protein
MKYSSSRIIVTFISSLLLLVCPVLAEQYHQQSLEIELADWSPVPDSTLSALRGGFVLGNGIVVDINFQKSILQNGELVSYFYFQSPQDINLLITDELNLASVLPDSTLNTVLQNTLDNQTLSAITNIDITIKNLEQAQRTFIQNERYNTYFDARNH